jgi:hypothetical protein
MESKNKKEKLTKEDKLENEKPEITEKFLTRNMAKTMNNFQSEKDICDVINCFCNPVKVRIPIPENEIYDQLNMNEQSENQEVENEQSEIFSCDLCPYSSNTRKWNLTRHISRVHNDEKPFECRHCDQQFKSQQRLSDHELAAHNPNFKGLQCPHCSVMLAFGTSIPKHIERFHKM